MVLVLYYLKRKQDQDIDQSKLNIKISHPIFWLLNFNFTLTFHQILRFRSIYLILISTARKFSFAFDSVYQSKVTCTTQNTQQKKLTGGAFRKKQKGAIILKPSIYYLYLIQLSSKSDSLFGVKRIM